MEKIMKKIFRILSLFLVLTLAPIQAFAKVESVQVESSIEKVTETNIVFSSQIPRIIGSARGRLLSSATIQISDEGNGVLGVYADTLCHTNMKDIYTTIYLEILDEDGETWLQLNSYDYEWHASSPEEDLSVAGVAFDVAGLERRRVYRLRSMHAVRSHEGVTEMMAPRTGAIILR